MHPPGSRFEHNPNDMFVISGAGFTGQNLYAKSLLGMGYNPDQIAFADINPGRLHEANQKYPGVLTFDSLTGAFEGLQATRRHVTAAVIASSTGAHMDNLRSVVHASEKGLIDLSRTRIACEKPIVPPEDFAAIMDLQQRHPHFNPTVSYILRHSGMLPTLLDHFEENGLKISSLAWEYGKDRSGDTRPTQGVYPDEVVHPLSVTDLLVGRNLGPDAKITAKNATILSEPFANPEVQRRAHAANPAIPLRPTSEVRANLTYELPDGHTVPVHIWSSFTMPQSRRRAHITTENSDGEHPNPPTGTYVLDFDNVQRADGKNIYTDTVRLVDTHKGTEEAVAFWQGNKASRQLMALLTGEGAEHTTTLREEASIQNTLGQIAVVAGFNPASQ